MYNEVVRLFVSSKDLQAELQVDSMNKARSTWQGASLDEDHNPSIPTLPDLPNELLSLIIVNACSASSSDFSVSLSHVCRRLRQLAISIPQIWTHVSNYQSPAELNAFLVRSKEEKLTLDLYAKNRDHSRCRPFLKEVLDHTHRWKEFRFEANVLRRNFFIELGRIPREEQSQRVQLPALETLHLRCYDPKYQLDERLHEWGVLYFWKAWKMPKLRNLSISIVTEDIIHDCRAFGTELTSLQADYRSIHWEEEALTNYTDFVGKFKSLRHLALVFHDLEDSDGGLLGADLTFPELRTLQILFTAKAFSNSDKPFDIWEDFMSCLCAPRLSQLSLRVDCAVDKDIIDWLRCISHHEILSLKELYLQFRALNAQFLIQFPPKDEGGGRNNAELWFSPSELTGMSLRDVPKLELSGYPEDSDTNLGDYLFQDKNALEYLKDYDWFREDL